MQEACIGRSVKERRTRRKKRENWCKKLIGTGVNVVLEQAERVAAYDGIEAC